jgi:hypothetical protein
VEPSVTERRRLIGGPLKEENLHVLSANDIVLASYGGAGQALVGNVLLNLGLNYVDPYTEKLRPDGGSTASAKYTEYRRRLAATHQHDTAVPDTRPFRPWPRFVKSHLPLERFQGCTFGGVWLLVRDPRDALYSWHQWRLGFAEDVWDKAPDEFDEFLRAPDYTGRSPIDDWNSFYEHWYERLTQMRRGVVIRFEDLKADTIATMRSALDSVDIRPTAAQLQAAVQASSYETMRAHEDLISSAELPASAGPQAVRRTATAQPRIMRKGEPGEWRRWITPPLARLFSTPSTVAVAATFGYQIDHS